MAWAPDYLVRDDLAAYVRIEDTLDDAQIALAITAASRSIDHACGRQFGRDDSLPVRYYTAYEDPVTGRMAVDVDDIATVTGVVVHVDTDGDDTYPDEVTSYSLRPRNAPADGEPYTQLLIGRAASVGFPSTEDAVRVQAAFGWSAVPQAIKQATAMQASRFLARRDAPFGVAGSPSAGSEVRLLAKLDPDVSVIVAPFKRDRLVIA